MTENTELLEWVNSVKWEKYIGNEKVTEKLTELKNIIGSVDTEGTSTTNPRVKLVVVGDGAVGKTCLLISYAKNKFPEDYVPTVFENYTAKLTREDGTQVLLHLWDTAGQEDYDRLRPLSYPGADIVLLCFSTVTASSFHSIKEKWYPEVNHYVPDTPYLLVGTKLDLREEKKPDPSTGEFEPVTPEQAEEMRKQIKAVGYIEVSAKTRKNLDKLFQMAVDIVFQVRREHGEDVPKAGNASTATSTNNSTNTAKANHTTETPIVPRRRRRCVIM
jgi:small GTP-binding protein